MMLYLMRPVRAGREMMTREKVKGILVDGVIEHWVWCKVYTVSYQSVKTKNLKMCSEFMFLVQTRSDR